MRPKFLLNAHITPLVAEILTQQGIDAAATAASSLAEASDEELLTLAGAQGRILVTYDTKTIPAQYDRLRAQGIKLPGVAYVKAKSIPQKDAAGLARAILKLAAAIEAGSDPLGVYYLSST